MLLVNASRRTFILAFCVWLLLLALLILGLELWDQTYTFVWTPFTTMPTTITATAAWAPFGEWKSRTIAGVWRDWHTVREWTPSGARETTIWWGPAEWIVTLTAILATFAAALSAWLFLPNVHRDGRAWDSYKRAFRGITAGCGLVMILWLVLRGGLILIKFNRVWSGGFWVSNAWEMASYVVIPAACCLGVAWLGRAARGTKRPPLELSLPPRCEGCGYDLTHPSTAGRCPECGIALTASLTPGALRPGSLWMRGPRGPRGPGAFWKTAWAALFAPRRFYQSLQLRTPGSTERGFAACHYVLITLATYIWLFGLFALLPAIQQAFIGVYDWWNTIDIPVENLFGFGGASLMVAAGCWFGHRLVAAMVVSSWLARKELPDCRWAAKVIAYESTFLWVFCLFWGVFMAVSTTWPSLFAKLYGHRYVAGLGIPIEVALLFLGTLALGAVWLWRYSIAFRAVRWNNY